VGSSEEGTGGMKVHLVACEVLKEEFLQVCPPEVTCTFIEQGLHRRPEQMPEAIQAAMRQAPAEAERIVLGYGLCSNGIVGVRAEGVPLVIPRVHDCIAMLLGSRERYEEEFARAPGTYYLTRGWISVATNPYKSYKEDYLKRYDAETARWIATELLKHYTRIALINNGAGDTEETRAYAKEMAEFFGFEMVEIEGSMGYFLRSLTGPWNAEDFVLVEAGQTVRSEDFLIGSAMPLL